MTNPRYLKGARKERRIAKEARDRGLIAIRSAGSKSPIDVVIIDAEKGKIELIQSKSDNFSEYAKVKLENKHAALNGLFDVCFKVV